MHDGGQQTYYAGLALLNVNGPPTSVRGMFERVHGECALWVGWSELLDVVLAGIKNSSGEADCNEFFCPDYDTKFTDRVARSYLRQSNPSQIGGPGRGGFGLHIRGNVEFDSPVIDDLTFYGRALYDVTLQEGLPYFSVSGGPWSDTWNSSSGPAKCPHTDVQNSVKTKLNEATGQLNTAMRECAAVPINLPCDTAEACAMSFPAVALASAAFNEAFTVRGLPENRAERFRDALTSPSNWTCAPVAANCAALTGAEATQDPVCQLNLRATDLVPMPDAFSLVWYAGDSSRSQVTAAAALYLALQNQQQAAQLERLCTPLPATTLRSFVRRAK